MNTSIRLFRTPFRTTIWLLLLAAAAVIVNLGVWLYLSTKNMETELKNSYTTIAVLKPLEPVTINGVTTITGSNALQAQERELLESFDMVERIDNRTITVAYSPAWEACLSAQTENSYLMDYDMPYNVILFSGTVLENKYQERPNMRYPALSGSINTADFLIEEVYNVHKGYTVKKGAQVLLHWTSSGFTLEPLKAGEKYVVYGAYEANDIKGNYSSGIPYVSVLSNKNLMIGSDGTIMYMDQERTYPAMEIINGSIEEFLKDPENEEWNRVAEEWKITRRSLPMIGTNCLESVYQFQQSQARITQGRSFLPEEYENGDNVCIISESLALANGITVGQTIPVYQYIGAKQTRNTQFYSYNSSNPTVPGYSNDIELPQEAQEFTVIGIYRKENLWEEGTYAFTPNTVFVPQNTLIAGAKNVGHGMFLSLKLRTGEEDAFQKACKGTILEGRFLIFDQGYEEKMAGVRDIRSLAGILLLIGVLSWGMVLVFYLILYQGREQNNIRIMRSMGTPRAKVRGYLFASAGAIGGSAAVLGAVAGSVCTVWAAESVKRYLIQLEKAAAEAVETGAVSEGELSDMALLGGELSYEVLFEKAASGGIGIFAICAVLQIVLFMVLMWAHTGVLVKKDEKRRETP